MDRLILPHEVIEGEYDGFPLQAMNFESLFDLREYQTLIYCLFIGLLGELLESLLDIDLVRVDAE